MGLVHGVSSGSLDNDHAHVVSAKKALDKKSRGVNKPKVLINVEDRQFLVRDAKDPLKVRRVLFSCPQFSFAYYNNNPLA